ncbi:ABC transporter permease [Hydrogenophaga sp.]|uniref:ABC transporter permease n=1 Tax=Hydrogenophaga sp. TaxID=1904254 RepID=UPI00273006B5|nr:ABC transporter permease [Hydrogenophaga sp.]MDP2015774.1 ABC transporter permease [Hydrogenophaga sp.]MDP3167452.1 ABC transporter permease [Hydrogenophaga sp.]MDP3809570.1 ABC transporter permease [Hydrogenophaga sp.]
MDMDAIGSVLLAILGGAVRVGTPFLFVSLGECLTEKSGRINLGLEGVLVFSAMSAFGVAYWSDSAWLGVLAGSASGALLALLHGLACSMKRVNDIAMGIGVMMLGIGLAFYLGKPLIQPQAPTLGSLPLGNWSDSPQVRAALNINVLFPIGVVLALLMSWAFANTRWGMLVRMVGDSSDAARALGTSVTWVRTLATTVGGAIAGLGGASLSLYYPGSWNEGLSSGQGLIAVALVIFARWRPMACLWTALLFGGAGALGPALQSVGVTGYYYLFNAVPYVMTLVILVVTCAPQRVLRGAPSELGVQR